MKLNTALKFIQNELRDLDVPNGSVAYKLTLADALELADIATKAELKRYIEEYVSLLPNHMFQD